VRSFAQLFRGRDDVLGTYKLPDGEFEEGEKRLGRARTVRAAVTLEHYADHLAGKEAIGIVPIMPGGNDCWWFAIDVDRYDNADQHYDFEKKIQKLSLPLVVCRSKSDGSHLYCYLTKPAPAKLCIDTAKKWCKLLGLGKVEIFPKQEKIRREDEGNWINLPYFGDTRKAVGLSGEDLSLDEFLTLAHAREISPSDLNANVEQATKATDAGEHSGAPPCILTMFRDGIPEGGRDEKLFHIGVYLRKAFPDHWEERLSDINAEKCDPPLKFSEVARIISSLKNKEYHYKCKALQDICQKPLCQTREFGIGTGESDVIDFVIDRLQKIDSDPPVWIVHMWGKSAKFTTQQLRNPELFRDAIMDKFNRLPGAMTKRAWEKYLTMLLERVEVEAAPDDISAPGQIMQVFRDWTTRMVQHAKTIERLYESHPYYDTKTQTLYWRGSDLLAQISRVVPGKINEKVVWTVLRDEGAETDKRYVGKEQLRLWKLQVADPWFPLPTNASAF
jgi:hypothetical protein